VLSARFSFEGLDAVVARILRHAPEAGYITIKDRTDRAREEPVGRFNLDEYDARAYLKPRVTDEPPTAVDLAKSACRWLRDIVARHWTGEEFRRFRVRIYQPNGAKLLGGGQFVCRDQLWADLGRDGVDPTEIGDQPSTAPTLDTDSMATAPESVEAPGDDCVVWSLIGRPFPGSAGPTPGIAGPNPGIAGPNPGIAGPAPGFARPAPGFARPAPGFAGPRPGTTGPVPGCTGPTRDSPGIALGAADLEPGAPATGPPTRPGKPPSHIHEPTQPEIHADH